LSTLFGRKFITLSVHLCLQAAARLPWSFAVMQRVARVR